MIGTRCGFLLVQEVVSAEEAAREVVLHFPRFRRLPLPPSCWLSLSPPSPPASLGINSSFTVEAVDGDWTGGIGTSPGVGHFLWNSRSVRRARGWSGQDWVLEPRKEVAGTLARRSPAGPALRQEA